jgi:ketosteroid isomerase-like protein
MPVPSSSVEATVRTFIARINAHDSRGVVVLCTPDHIFIDSLGARLSGVADLERAWAGYFALFPDYRIEVDSMISKEGLVLLSGWASATLRGKGPSWRIPAAWRGVVADGRVAEWQVYADNKPVYEALSGDA